MGNNGPQFATGTINRVVADASSQREFSDLLNELAHTRVTVFFTPAGGTTTVKALNVPESVVLEAIQGYEATH